MEALVAPRLMSITTPKHEEAGLASLCKADCALAVVAEAAEP